MTKMICYDSLRHTEKAVRRGHHLIEGSMERDVLHMLKEGLNAPKFLYTPTKSDFDMGRDMMRAEMFATPFGTYVVESDTDTPGHKMTTVIKVKENQFNAMMADVLLVYKDNVDGAVLLLSILLNSKEIIVTRASTSLTEAERFGFTGPLTHTILGLSAALLQCQASTQRFGFRHRTSRHPVPTEWGGQPFYTYTVVNKDRNPLPIVRRASHPTGIEQRRHTRMGHWRWKDDPAKRRWIDAYEAGNAKLGYVFKDYSLTQQGT